MIDNVGMRLYSKMMCLIMVEENHISTEVKDAMAAFDNHMNALNKTTEILYSKGGEALMKW